jgi:uncharacterized protein YecE (DUF72 family)
MSKLRIGTCSWKYDAWKGIIYPDLDSFNYLQHYSKYYNTVEIDQWFWSLSERISLPDPSLASEYAASVPDDFKFTIKVPNSLTLTHYYKSDRPNVEFLSVELYEEFLERIEPLLPKTSFLIFQFEYLNRMKIGSAKELQKKLFHFLGKIPSSSPPIAVEIRNPNYLSTAWFRFLKDMNMPHILMEGYFMPHVWNVYSRNAAFFGDNVIIRLHGPARSDMEKLSGKDWSKIYIHRDEEIHEIVSMVKTMLQKDINIHLNVNNHFEGCAPYTIKKITSKLD